MAQPVIVLYGDACDYFMAPVQASTVLKKGDLLYGTARYAKKLANVTNDAQFWGVADEDSLSTSSTSIRVVRRCILDIAVDSGSYNYGLGLKYSATNQLVDDGGANTIAWTHEAASGTQTRIKVLIDVAGLQKKHEVNA